MGKTNRTRLTVLARKHRLGAFLLAEAAVLAVHVLLRKTDFDQFLPGLDKIKQWLDTLLLCAALLVWSSWARRRITNPHIASLAAITAALLAMYLLVQRVRFWLPLEDAPVSRILWYMYYIPMVFVPATGYLAARHMGKTDDFKPPERNAVLAISSLLCLAFLTNDLHQLAFSFDPAGNWNSEYSRGPVYFLGALWMGGTAVAMVARLSRGCSVPSGRRRAWIPLLSVAAFCAYCLVYTLLPAGTVPLDLELAPAFCACTITMWESCIQVGLIPSNHDYAALFDASTVGMRILDERGETIALSKTAPPLDAGDLHLAEHGEEPIREGWRLRQAPTPMGQVVWYEDVRLVEDVRERLSRLRGSLTEKNSLLQSENSLAAKQARIDARNAVYDRIELDTDEVLKEFESLLAQGRTNPARRREALERACVLGAYLKRKANLAILGQSAREIPVAELVLSLKEVMDNLAVFGAECSITLPPAGSVTCEDAARVLDAFFAEASAMVPGLGTLLAAVAPQQDGSLAVKVTYESSAGSGFLRIVLRKGVVNVERLSPNRDEGGQNGAV